MVFLLVETPEAVGPQRLKNANKNKTVKLFFKIYPVDRDEGTQFIEIMLQKVQADFLRNIGFGIVEQRRQIIRQGTPSPSLVVDKP